MAGGEGSLGATGLIVLGIWQRDAGGIGVCSVKKKGKCSDVEL